MNRIKRKATGENNENNSNLGGKRARGAGAGASEAKGAARGGKGWRGGANGGKKPSEKSIISEYYKPMKK